MHNVACAAVIAGSSSVAFNDIIFVAHAFLHPLMECCKLSILVFGSLPWYQHCSLFPNLTLSILDERSNHFINTPSRQQCRLSANTCWQFPHFPSSHHHSSTSCQLRFAMLIDGGGNATNHCNARGTGIDMVCDFLPEDSLRAAITYWKT